MNMPNLTKHIKSQMFKKWQHTGLIVLAFGLSDVAVNSFGNEANCLRDLRSVWIADQVQPELTIEMKRFYEAPDGASAAIPAITIREDATAVDASWMVISRQEYKNGFTFDSHAELNVIKQGIAIQNKTTHEYIFPAISGSNSLLIRITYHLTESLGSELWWASYAPAVDNEKLPAECELRLVTHKDVVSQCAGPWQSTSNQLSNGLCEYKWKLDAKKNGTQTNLSMNGAPYVYVGTSTTWSAVGQRLREQLMRRNLGFHAVNAMDALVLKLEEEKVQTAFNEIGAFRREPAAPGFTAKSRAEISAVHAGDCKDLSFLLAERLNAQDVPCSLVYRATTMNTLEGLMPCPYYFDHVLVAVPIDTGTWMLDPFAGKTWTISGWRCGSQVEIHENQLFVPSATMNLTSNQHSQTLN